MPCFASKRDDDDQGSQPTENEERDFEIEYTGMTASMRGSIGVDVHAASPRLNTWDLRTQTSQQRDGGVKAENVKLGTKITPRTLSEGDCNFLLNHLFGSPGSVAASGHEPKELQHMVAGEYRAGGRQTHFGTNIHMYGDSTGTRKGAPLYAPANLNGTAPKYLTSYTGEGDYSSGTFYSGQYNDAEDPKGPPRWSNKFIFQYNNGLTISFGHVAGGYGGESGATSIGKDFMRGGRLIGSRNTAGSYQIGFIGGPGGGDSGYIHSHLAFWRNGIKIDPRVEFCGGGSRF